MKRIDKYITAQFLKYYFATFSGFIIMLVVLDLSGKVGKFSKGGFFLNFIRHYASELPFVLNLLVPIISLMAVLFTIIGLKRKNELTCLLSSGISIHRILLPMTAILLLSVPLLFINSEIIKPYFSRQKQSPSENALLASIITQEHVSLSSANRITTEEGREKAEYFSLTIIEKKTGKLELFLFTPAAYWSEESSFWDFNKHGIVLQTEQGTDIDPALLLKKLGRFPAILIPTPTRLKISSRVPSSLSIRELTHIMPSRHAVMEVFHRITFPFVMFILVYLSIPFSVRLDRKSSAFIGVGICLVSIFIVFGVVFSALSIGGKGIIPPWAAGLAPIIVFPLPAFLIYRKIRT